jgi:dTDP-glucose 4,6-dehydratase
VEADPGQAARFAFVEGDVADPDVVGRLAADADSIVNFAAESHVDRSITGPAVFIRTNVQGTLCLLEAAKEAGVGLFLQVSTDEVYGSLGPTGRFREETPLSPNSPYSASKASADLLCRAFHSTWGFPVVVTRCSNNYGPYQFPEKLVPLMIHHALDGRPLPVYGDGQQVRDWIHVEDHCRALLEVLLRGKPGETYNIGGGNERENIEIVRVILRELGRPEGLIRHVTDRAGHDRRYAIDSGRIRRELGWGPRIPFEEGLRSTIRWYVENRPWWERVLSGEYMKFYELYYKDRR